MKSGKIGSEVVFRGWFVVLLIEDGWDTSEVPGFVMGALCFHCSGTVLAESLTTTFLSGSLQRLQEWFIRYSSHAKCSHRWSHTLHPGLVCSMCGSSLQLLTEEHAWSGADFNSLAHLLWQSMREIKFKGFKFGLTWFVTFNPFRHQPCKLKLQPSEGLFTGEIRWRSGHWVAALLAAALT